MAKAEPEASISPVKTAIHLRRVLKSTKVTPRVVGALSVITVILLWETQFNSNPFLPRPTVVLSRMLELGREGILADHFLATFQRVIVAFSIASSLGFVLAIVCFSFRIIDWALAPWIEFIRCLSPFSLLPAFMLIFGLGVVSKVAMTVWVAWVPVFISTIDGLRNVDTRLIKAARSMGSTRIQTVQTVVIPACLPSVFSGLRLAIGACLLVSVAAEMFGSGRGLGYFILESSQTFRIADMYSAIWVLGLTGFVANWLFLGLTQLVTPWRER